MEKVHLEKLIIDDFEDYYNLKCEKQNIFWTNNLEKPNKEKLFQWFTEQMGNKNRVILGLKYIENRRVIGYVYLDFVGAKSELIELSYALSEEYINRGLGTRIVGLAINYCRDTYISVKKIQCWVLEDNVRSRKCLINNGFIKKEDEKVILFYPENRMKKMNLFKLDI
ncbi:GNAT family N-acetyltransferase [Inconstantimicrobium mannanitabidum]|uniref:Uncharacterized protein n=1 Tax=Inconstantimicrobium mannanitabidum TaxID=1604901 RepID=A0ACB5R8L2_9CLOT|nr:GNAT family protein [Clostridium sp. TW13]GKX65528.1 hypothetical protein rsdtw13_07860 [Clostridium sp. TW13]